MSGSEDLPKLCDECSSLIDIYLEQCQRQSEPLQILVDLSLGITSDDGISPEAISRIGALLSELISKRAALDHFFFGGGTTTLEHFDPSVIDDELAILKKRYNSTARLNNEI